MEVLPYKIYFILKRIKTVILTKTTSQISEVINKDIVYKTENIKEKMKVISHVKHKWHSFVIFLLVTKAFKLSLKVVYYDRNMYLLYKNGMVVLTAFIYLATFEEACSPDSMNCIRGCNYSFMYS
jgi:hypothetical protein